MLGIYHTNASDEYLNACICCVLSGVIIGCGSSLILYVAHRSEDGIPSVQLLCPMCICISHSRLMREWDAIQIGQRNWTGFTLEASTTLGKFLS